MFKSGVSTVETNYKRHIEQVYESCKNSAMLTQLLNIMSQTLDVSGVGPDASRKKQQKLMGEAMKKKYKVVRARFALGDDDGAYLRMNIMPLQTAIEDEEEKYRLSTKMSLEMQNASFQGLLDAYEMSRKDKLKEQKSSLLAIWGVVNWFLSIEEVHDFVICKLKTIEDKDLCLVSKSESFVGHSRTLDRVPDLDDCESIKALQLVLEILYSLFDKELRDDVNAHLKKTQYSMDLFKECFDAADNLVQEKEDEEANANTWHKWFTRAKSRYKDSSILAYEKVDYLSYALARGLCGRRAPHHEISSKESELRYNVPKARFPSLDAVSDLLCIKNLEDSETLTLKTKAGRVDVQGDFCHFSNKKALPALWVPSIDDTLNDTLDENVAACSVIEHLVDHYKETASHYAGREDEPKFLAHAAAAKLLQLEFMAVVLAQPERHELCVGNNYLTNPTKNMGSDVCYPPDAGLVHVKAGFVYKSADEAKDDAKAATGAANAAIEAAKAAKAAAIEAAKAAKDAPKASNVAGTAADNVVTPTDIVAATAAFNAVAEQITAAVKAAEAAKAAAEAAAGAVAAARAVNNKNAAYEFAKEATDAASQITAIGTEAQNAYIAVIDLTPENIASYEIASGKIESMKRKITEGLDAVADIAGKVREVAVKANTEAEELDNVDDATKNDLNIDMKKDVSEKLEGQDPNICLTADVRAILPDNYKQPKIRNGSFAVVLPPERTKDMINKDASTLFKHSFLILSRRCHLIKQLDDTAEAKNKLEERHEKFEDVVKELENMARSRREEVWNDSMREAAIAGDRLYAFVRQLSGTIHETVDAVCVVDESMLVKQQKDRQADFKRLSAMASQQQMQLVSNVFRSVINESGLTLGIDERTGLDGELKIVSNTLRKQVSELASGSSNSDGFFTNSVKLENLLAQGTGEITLSGLFKKLKEVGLALQDAAINDITSPDNATGPSLDFLSSPRNSLVLRWKPEAHAAIRQAFDTFQREMTHRHRISGTLGRHRKITAYELMEGRSDELSMAFATYCAHTLAHQRMFSAGQAAYLGQWAARANIAAMRFSCDKLISVACDYVTNTERPNFVHDNGWERYFGVK